MSYYFFLLFYLTNFTCKVLCSFCPFLFVQFTNLHYDFCNFEVSTILLPLRTQKYFMCLCVWLLEISSLTLILKWHWFFPVILPSVSLSFLPHSAQGFRFSSARLFIWLLMWLLVMNPLPHRAQWYINFPWYEFLCGFLCGLLCGVRLYIPNLIIMARNNAPFQ